MTRFAKIVGYTIGTVACGLCSLAMLRASLGTPGIDGYVMWALSLVYVFGAMVNAMGVYRALPGNSDAND